MMARTQITLDSETQRRARRKAAEMGVSLAEYIRRLVRSDLGSPARKVSPDLIFDLGSSGASDIAKEKKRMIGEAAARRRIARA